LRPTRHRDVAVTAADAREITWRMQFRGCYSHCERMCLRADRTVPASPVRCLRPIRVAVGADEGEQQLPEVPVHDMGGVRGVEAGFPRDRPICRRPRHTRRRRHQRRRRHAAVGAQEQLRRDVTPQTMHGLAQHTARQAS